MLHATVQELRRLGNFSAETRQINCGLLPWTWLSRSANAWNVEGFTPLARIVLSREVVQARPRILSGKPTAVPASG